MQAWDQGGAAELNTHAFPNCGQGCGAMLVPLGTLGTRQGQVASANRVSAVETLTPRTLMPVTPARGNACAAYTTRRGRTVPTASLASMGRLPDRAVTVSVGLGGDGWGRALLLGLPLINVLDCHRLQLQLAGYRSPAVPIR